MFKHIIQWLLSLMALLLIAMYLLLSPVLSTRAAAPHVAAPATSTHSAAPAEQSANMRWRP